MQVKRNVNREHTQIEPEDVNFPLAKVVAAVSKCGALRPKCGQEGAKADPARKDGPARPECKPNYR